MVIGVSSREISNRLTGALAVTAVKRPLSNVGSRRGPHGPDDGRTTWLTFHRDGGRSSPSTAREPEVS